MDGKGEKKEGVVDLDGCLCRLESVVEAALLLAQEGEQHGLGTVAGGGGCINGCVPGPGLGCQDGEN